MSDRIPILIAPALDGNGTPINGSTLEFFQTDTSTPKAVYTDAEKTASATSITADAAGRFGNIFGDTDVAYKIVWKDASAVEIATFDPVTPILPPGSFPVLAVASKSANYTVLTTDRGAVILVDASSGAVTITLLPVATAASGFSLWGVKIDSSANVVTLDGDGAETINGSPTLELTAQYDAAQLAGDGTAWYALVRPLQSDYPPGHLDGLTLSADSGDTSNDVNAEAGSARDGDDTENMVLASEITKQIDAAWTVGDDQGGLDTGTVANGNRYYIWLIKRTDTDVVDVLFSLSATSPTMPSNYTKKRLLGYLDRESAANTNLTKINTSSQIVQVISTQDGAVATGTTTMPLDDTIPQNTEGDEYMTVTITPTNASNKLVIEAEVQVSTSAAAATLTMALFKDSTADALAAAGQRYVSGTETRIYLRHVVAAGGTAAQTYKIRIGSNSAGTTTFNGTSGNRRYGGVSASSITVTEVAA